MDLPVGAFTVRVQNETITILRDNGSLAFAPGEGEHASKVVGCAMSCRKIKKLPPEIGVGSFRVDFRKDDCFLRRENDPNGISFTFKEADQLMSAIDMGVNKVIDENRIRGGAQKGFNAINTPEVL